MDLTGRYIDGKTDFSSYDDFYRNCKLNVPARFNFAVDVVDFYAANEPEKNALVWCNDKGQEKIFTFSQISQESKKAAAFLLSSGIKKGDTVMLSLHRRYEYWFFIIALHRIGAVALPVASQLLKDDLEYRIKTSNTKMIIAAPHADSINQLEQACRKNTILVSVDFTKDGWIDYSSINISQSEYEKRLAEISDSVDSISGESPMLIYFTSGTAGNPKMVVHNYLYPLAHIITAKYWQRVVPDGLHLSIAETGWAKSSWGKIYGQWIAGSAVFVYDRQTFSPEQILEKIAKYKVTTFCANPTVYRYLINLDFSNYDLSSLKHCCCAGESLFPDIYETFYHKTGLRIHEGYGQSETALLTANFYSASEGSMGKPSPLYDVKILDENGAECSCGQSGEVVLNLKQGHPIGLFSEYFNETELTQNAFKNDCYHTGDIAYKDNDGNFYFQGRKDDIIKSSGFRISPYEVESVLNRHPAVMESSVTGEKDEIRGQIVAAMVVVAQGYEPSKNLEHEILSFMHKNTAQYKCPRKITFVKELPKTYNGKVIRQKQSEES